MRMWQKPTSCTAAEAVLCIRAFGMQLASASCTVMSRKEAARQPQMHCAMFWGRESLLRGEQLL